MQGNWISAVATKQNSSFIAGIFIHGSRVLFLSNKKAKMNRATMHLFNRLLWCQARKESVQSVSRASVLLPHDLFVRLSSKYAYQFNKHLIMCLTMIVPDFHWHRTPVCIEDLFWITLFYYPLASPEKHLDVAKANSAAEAKLILEVANQGGLQPGQGSDAPAVRQGPARAVLDSILPQPSSAAGRGHIK